MILPKLLNFIECLPDRKVMLLGEKRMSLLVSVISDQFDDENGILFRIGVEDEFNVFSDAVIF